MYIKQLRLSLQGKTGPALQEEENKIKIVALRTTSNINAVIKVLGFGDVCLLCIICSYCNPFLFSELLHVHVFVLFS